ncbi:MAG TPA: hypothetical protein VGA73_11380 [Candidatus Binatia bacterium]
MRNIIVYSLLGALVWLAAEAARPVAALSAESVTVADQAPGTVSIRNLSIKDGVVSGEVQNTSNTPVRDVQLLIRYTWIWKNEMKPGADDRSDAVYYTVEGELPPGASKPLTYRPPTPKTGGPDGHYEVTVSVAGFTRIIPQK